MPPLLSPHRDVLQASRPRKSHLALRYVRIGTNREENFSAKRAPSLQATWLPPSHVDQGWSTSDFKSSSPRPRQAIGLIQPLRSRASFAQLSQHGRRRQGRWCWVRWAPPVEYTDTAAPTSPEVPFVGYAIGKKVGNAVVRNRIRRRLRPLVVEMAPGLPPGFYLIGVKNDRAASVSYEELRKDLQTVLTTASERSR